MNKLVKGLLIGGAVGAGAMAVRAYRRDDEADNARDDILRGAAVGAAAGIALGIIGELTPKAAQVVADKTDVKDLKKKLKRLKSRAKTARFAAKQAQRVSKKARKKLSMLEWGQLLAVATPIMHTVVEVAKSRAEAAVHYESRQKKKQQKRPQTSPDSVVIPGPLGRVRLSTMHFGESISGQASKVRTRVRPSRRGQSHNGSH